jgi:pimeloyl-ACP methyl ester carboxylesterase
MDGWDYLEPYDINDSGLVVGIAWHTDPSNPTGPGEQHAFLLVPAELIVDGNRDGEMSFEDPLQHSNDETTEDRPYQFWVNDDQDAGSGTNVSEEVTPPQLRDNQDEKIQSVRDCEDLTRIWLNLNGLTESLKSGALRLVIRFRNIRSGNPGIRIFRAAENGGRGYVTDEGWGTLQASAAFNQALPGTNGPGVASANTGIHLDRQFWQGIDESNPVVNLLFEGVDEGNGELYCQFIDRNGQVRGTTAGVWLSIQNIKRLYQRVKVISQPSDIRPPSDVTNGTVPEPNMTWVADPNNYGFDYSSTSSEPTKEYIILVHGWNMTYARSENYAETMFKRLWHQGFKGRFVRFYWPTYVGIFTYNDSEYRAWKSGESLRLFTESLPTDYSINLVSHSMGGIVAGSALAKGMTIKNYALCHASLPAACYDDSASLDQGWGYSTPHYDPDLLTRNLSYRYKLNKTNGNLINFYLPSDSALEIWEVNNDSPIGGRFPAGAKPQTYFFGNYFYNPAAEPDERLGLGSNLGITRRPVNTSHEGMSYVAQSPTKTVGADGRTNGSIKRRVDLGTYGFETLHSAEYELTAQKTSPFYSRLLEEFDISFVP